MGFLDDHTAKLLNEFKITRVISGHQPHTDSPWIMKKNNITVITADTS
jgi:hypothetical protein